MHKLRPLNMAALHAELACVQHRSAESRYAHRLHAVLLVGIGHSCYQVADWLGHDARCIERWVRAYDLLGVDGLKCHPGAGRPGRLTAAQSAQLVRDLANAPDGPGRQQCWSGKRLALHLERQFGVTLSLRRCQRLLQLNKH